MTSARILPFHSASAVPVLHYARPTPSVHERTWLLAFIMACGLMHAPLWAIKWVEFYRRVMHLDGLMPATLVDLIAANRPMVLTLLGIVAWPAMFGRPGALRLLSRGVWIMLPLALLSAGWWSLLQGLNSARVLAAWKEVLAMNGAVLFSWVIVDCFPYVVVAALAGRREEKEGPGRGKRMWRMAAAAAVIYGAMGLVPWVLQFKECWAQIMWDLPLAFRKWDLSASGDAVAHLAVACGSVLLIAGVVLIGLGWGRLILKIGTSLLLVRAAGIVVGLAGLYATYGSGSGSYAMQFNLLRHLAEQSALLGESLIFPLAIRAAIRMPEVRDYLKTKMTARPMPGLEMLSAGRRQSLAPQIPGQ